jgi:hypothetical protein
MLKYYMLLAQLAQGNMLNLWASYKKSPLSRELIGRTLISLLKAGGMKASGCGFAKVARKK